jgi:hypothetical protein
MLTKAETGKLSVEQQEILAQMEFRKTQQRLKLLEQARGLDWRSRYFPIYIFAVFLVFLTLYYFDVFHAQAQPAILYLPIGMILVFSLVFHITRVNRRLDALLELMDFDREHPKQPSHSNDEKNIG